MATVQEGGMKRRLFYVESTHGELKSLGSQKKSRVVHEGVRAAPSQGFGNGHTQAGMTGDRYHDGKRLKFHDVTQPEEEKD